MENLCFHALEADIEVAYVQRLIARRDLNITNPQLMLENWPWPLQLYCFGRFDIVRKGKQVKSGGKAQQKPLVLLKALVAQGGRNISVSSLANLLWPEADGDMQMQNFNTTLHRLRKILGVTDVLTLQSGELTLNNNYCWVDVWRFERLAKDMEGKEEKDGRPIIDLQAAKDAVSLYHGPFLTSEDAAWALPARDRLTTKFVQIIEKLSTYYSLRKKWTEAIIYCRKGVDQAPLAEDLHYQLILCQKEAGQYTDALQTYQTYRSFLASSLAVSPSKKITALYEEIKSGL